MNDFQLYNKDITRLPVLNLEYAHIKDSASVYSPMSLGMKKLKFHHEKEKCINGRSFKLNRPFS